MTQLRIKMRPTHRRRVHITPAALYDGQRGVLVRRARRVTLVIGLWIIALALSHASPLRGESELVAVAPTAGSSAPVQKHIAWKPIPGNAGYIVQLQMPDGRVREHRLKTAAISLELPPAKYRMRVAALNKFGRPAKWTAWRSMRIAAARPKPENRPEPAEERPAVSQTEDPQATEQPETAETPNASEAGLWPGALIPGWNQFARGDRWRGAAWLGAFGGLALGGWSAWQSGNALAAGAEQATPFFALAALSNQPAASLVLWNQRLSDRAAHSAAQSTQQNLALVAGALYLLQIVDAVWGGGSSYADRGVTAAQSRSGWRITTGANPGGNLVRRDFASPARAAVAGEQPDVRLGVGYALRF